MIEPTLKQAKNFLKLIDDAGIDIDQMTAANESGLLSIFIKANFQEIDEVAFKTVCGFVVVPSIDEVFKLEIGNTSRTFKLLSIHYRSGDNMGVRDYACIIEEEKYKLADRECLESFRKRYLKSDGLGFICIAVPDNIDYDYPALGGKRGSNWGHVFLPNMHKQSWRWLVEVVDQKAEQPKPLEQSEKFEQPAETPEWKEFTLIESTAVYNQRDCPDYSVVSLAAAVIPSGTKVECGKPIEKANAGNICLFVPYRRIVLKRFQYGYFLMRDLPDFVIKELLGH